MKIKTWFRNFEKGQILPMVVIGILVIIMMAALLIDGGMIMSNKRQAQAAADAGALAGAKRICDGYTNWEAEKEAEDYAALNGATFVSATANGKEITVYAEVEGPAFFARIFDEDSLRATTRAVAGCYHPSVFERILPIAFYYETPPKKAQDTDCGDLSKPCDLVNWDFEELMQELRNNLSTPENLPLDNIYIVADSTKICEKYGTGDVVCTDMKDNADGGNRTWIELDVLVDGNLNLKKIIKDGVDHPLYMPAWIEGVPGTNSAVYKEDNYSQLEPLPGYTDLDIRIVTIPLFTDYCPKAKNFELDCYQAGDNIYIDKDNTIADADKVDSYRLSGGAPFIITCATFSGKCEFGQCVPPKTGPNQTNKSICPGLMISDENFDTENYVITKDPSTKNALEGYFVDDIPTDVWAGGKEGVDAGYYQIFLSE